MVSAKPHLILLGTGLERQSGEIAHHRSGLQQSESVDEEMDFRRVLMWGIRCESSLHRLQPDISHQCSHSVPTDIYPRLNHPPSFNGSQQPVAVSYKLASSAHNVR